MKEDHEEKLPLHFTQEKLGANAWMDARAEPCPLPALFADPCGERATDAEHMLQGEAPG